MLTLCPEVLAIGIDHWVSGQSRVQLVKIEPCTCLMNFESKAVAKHSQVSLVQ